MFDAIIDEIVKHLSLLDSIKSQSKNIFYNALEEKDGSVSLCLENRNRLISEAQKIKNGVENKLNKIPPNIDIKEKEYINEIISAWCEDINRFIQLSSRIDSEIEEVLNIQKELTKIKIKEISSGRRKVSGYNSSTTK